jgi:metal-responsive CopG/Arc/MetJ family transcriptional regulator
MNNEKITYMTITIPESWLKELTHISKENRISRSFIVRELIKKFIWDYKKSGKIF